MIVDASALLAIVFGEPDAFRFAAAMADADQLILPSCTWFEACLVIDRRSNGSHSAAFDRMIVESSMTIAPVTADHMRLAREAWARYGRGAHAAGLNFGDCMVYGFAKATGQPLLFKGNDFGQTDIPPALKD